MFMTGYDNEIIIKSLNVGPAKSLKPENISYISKEPGVEDEGNVLEEGELEWIGGLGVCEMRGERQIWNKVFE